MSPLAHRPGFLIRRMHQIHVALFAEECRGFDITPVQYSIMTVAAAQPNLDQAQLAFEVGIDRATLANVVARLEVKSLLARRPSKTDKRMKLVTLTPSGADLLHQMRPHVQRAHDRTIESLAAPARETFLHLLTILIDAQNSHGRAPLRLS